MEKIYVIVRGKTNQVASQYFFEKFEDAEWHIRFYKMQGVEIRSLLSATKNLDFKTINVGPEPKI